MTIYAVYIWAVDVELQYPATGNGSYIHTRILTEDIEIGGSDRVAVVIGRVTPDDCDVIGRDVTQRQSISGRRESTADDS